MLASILVFLAVLWGSLLALPVPAAHAASCGATLTYSALGDTQSTSIAACSTFFQPVSNETNVPNRWGGLKSATGQRMRTTVNCGIGGTGANVDGQGICVPSPTTVTTENATYSFSGDYDTADFSITLVSKNATPAVTDTLTLYTYVGAADRTVAQSLSNTAFTFTFNLPDTGVSTSPTVASLSPSSGVAGTAVTVTGTGFTGATGVTFGGMAASFTPVNDTTINAIAPAGAGVVDVAVTTPAGASANGSGSKFTYDSSAALVISPADGTPLSGGTVGTPYSNTSISASGGIGAISFTASGLPAGLSINSSTGAITGTPTTAGSASVTVTATDAVSASISATYAIDIAATVPSAPDIGSATAGDGDATVTFTPPASDGGAMVTSYTVTSSPGGFIATGATSPITITGLTNDTAYTFTVTATNSVGTGPASAASNSVTPASTLAAPVANAVSTTVAVNSSSNAMPLAITGGAADSVAVVRNGTHGTATASGTSITYTPNAGYSGSDSFTYTATNAAGTSVAATVTIAIAQAAPTVTLTASPTNPDLGATVTFTATLSGGSSPSGTVTFKDGAATLGSDPVSDTSTSFSTAALTTGSHAITAEYAGDASNVAATSNTVTVTVAAPTLAFSPAAGALTSGTVGTAYSRTLTVSGGTAPYAYGASGTLPPGLTFDTSTGAISGTPTSAGGYNFTVTATDANGASGSAGYSLTVNPAATTFVFTPPGGALAEGMVGEDYSQPISAEGGSGALIYSLASGTLPEGMTLNISTGELTGPLATDAEAKDYSFTIGVRDGNGATGTATFTLTVKPRAVTVTDKVVNVAAGSSPADVYLNRGATGGPFTSAATTFVEPANAGTATVIRGQLALAGPATTPVGWYLQFTPNPAYTGQVRVGFRLTSALGISNTGTVTYNLSYDPAQVADDIDQLVHDFVRTRQNMIASTIKVPGLLERRQMEQASDPVTARMMPSDDGLTVGFSTSLAQMEAAADSADGASGGYSSPFNIWIDGAFLAHNDKDINGDKWGSFAMLNLGADYLLSDKALFGLSFHYDRMTDPTEEDAELTGNGWMAGPYASFELGKGVFWNASLLYGGSSNDIDTEFWDGTFDTTRWMADTSIEGQWRLGQDTVLTPKLRAVYFSENVDDYTVKNDAGDEIGIDGFDEQQFRVSLGAEIARSFTLANDMTLTPKIGVTGGFSGLDGSGAFGSIKAGLSLQTADLWMLDASLLFDIEEEGDKSIGARVGASRNF